MDDIQAIRDYAVCRMTDTFDQMIESGEEDTVLKGDDYEDAIRNLSFHIKAMSQIEYNDIDELLTDVCGFYANRVISRQITNDHPVECIAEIMAIADVEPEAWFAKQADTDEDE